MIEDWLPDNLPIMLLNRSLLSATRSKPMQIGNAAVTVQDENSLIALDKLFADGTVDEDEDTGQYSVAKRYQASADWIGDIAGLPYQVSYYFPSRVRPNRVGSATYGSKGLTFRVLYEALCDGFNNGRRFIEDYFVNLFEARMRDQYEDHVMDLKQRVADEAQRRRGMKKAYLRNFDEWSSPLTRNTFSTLARDTKKDIENCLSTGKIPLAKASLSDSTMKIRERLGLDPTTVFYATGRLIRSIVVSVILLDHETAEREGVS